MYCIIQLLVGWDSFVCTSDSLQAGQFTDQMLVGTRFSALIQSGPGACPASYRRGSVLFLGVKEPGCGVNHPPSSNTDIKERVQQYLYSLPVPSWHVIW